MPGKNLSSESWSSTVSSEVCCNMSQAWKLDFFDLRIKKTTLKINLFKKHPQRSLLGHSVVSDKTENLKELWQ